MPAAAVAVIVFFFPRLAPLMALLVADRFGVSLFPAGIVAAEGQFPQHLRSSVKHHRVSGLEAGDDLREAQHRKKGDDSQYGTHGRSSKAVPATGTPDPGAHDGQNTTPPFAGGGRGAKGTSDGGPLQLEVWARTLPHLGLVEIQGHVAQGNHSAHLAAGVHDQQVPDLAVGNDFGRLFDVVVLAAGNHRLDDLIREAWTYSK
jgi:hypothetical protein